MVFLILFTAVVMGISALLVWPAIRGTEEESDRPRKATAAGPDSLEGVLVAQRYAGAITCGQYLRAMEGIAARDDERHPLSVPPDAESAA